MSSHPILFAPTLPNPDRPPLVFLPGLDGTGRLLAPQVPELAQAFDLRCSFIPPDNRQSWAELADTLVAHWQPWLGKRPLYLVGESFGGCLALQIALRYPQQVKNLIVLNAASALQQQFWLRWVSQVASWVPEWAFRNSGAITLNLLANFDRIAPDVQRLFMDTVRAIPQDCVAWRLSMLLDFAPVPDAFQRLTMPTLLLASDCDRLLPSQQEAERLQRLIPQAQMYSLPGSGHAALLEDPVNLADILAATHRLPRAPSTPI